MFESTEPTKRLRVLIVDDDPVTRLLAGQALEAVGFEIETVENGHAALASVEGAPPDLVVLDIEMPGIDGFETCAALRARAASQEIPVLIATGLTDSNTIDRAFESGATDFIKKPLDWQILQHRVRFVMRASRAFSDLRQTLGHLRKSQLRLANAQRIARVGNWEWVPGEPHMLWSDEVFRIFHQEPTDRIPTFEALRKGVHADDRVNFEKAIRAGISEATGCSLEHRIVTVTGEVRIVQQRAEVIRDAAGRIDRIAGTIQDITERRRAEEQIRYLSDYDSLTALPNRRLLNEQLTQLLDRSRHEPESIAVLFLDLDRFNRVNDTLGHGIGDELLKAAAARLMKCMKASEQESGAESPQPSWVYRPGGDEFAVVLQNLRSPDEAAAAARRILVALRHPFEIEGRELLMSASIGIAMHPSDGQDADTLLRNADAAMHDAKTGGRDIYRFFSESVNESATRKLQLETGLLSAFMRGELRLHYQPQVDVHTGTITAVEALARWSSSELGPISPGEFIPLAEETGLIGSLGQWALRTACTQLRAWRDAGFAGVMMAVNVSSQQVRKGGLVHLVERELRSAGLEPQMLEIEITESALLADEPEVVATLTALHELGVRLALDDFGTGYSSLSHLTRFPIDTLKIDRSFTSGLGESAQATTIVAALIAMAHRLSLTVVAEGVETSTHEELLRTEGCDRLQGFHLARPMEAEAVVPLLKDAGDD